MARKPRIHFPGALYHVMLRGNGGSDIFRSPADRSKLLFLVQEGVEKYGHRIHAYCLMGNHIHLLVQVGTTPLSKIIQNLSFRYTRYFNRASERTGHLFQGRYKAILLDGEGYLLELTRYISCNPVRAGIVHHCGDYYWSSHRAYCGEMDVPWLTTDMVLGHFSQYETTARKLYREFVRQGEHEERRPEFHKGSFEGRILGDDSFLEKVRAQADVTIGPAVTLEQIVDAVCDEYGVFCTVLAAPGRKGTHVEARAMAALIVDQTEGITQTNLAKTFHRDLSGICQSAARLKKRMQKDQHLQQRLDRIRGQIWGQA